MHLKRIAVPPDIAPAQRHPGIPRPAGPRAPHQRSVAGLELEGGRLRGRGMRQYVAQSSYLAVYVRGSRFA